MRTVEITVRAQSAARQQDTATCRSECARRGTGAAGSGVGVGVRAGPGPGRRWGRPGAPHPGTAGAPASVTGEQFAQSGAADLDTKGCF